jgi:osmotically-inducible protein OsmY
MHNFKRVTLPETQREGLSGRGPKGYIRPDARIYEEACELLTVHDAIDASDIEVTVARGFVTLTGSVETLREKMLSEQIMRRVLGVAGILCRVTVRRLDGTIEAARREIW